MTYTPPGQEPQQPSYSAPQQSGYSTPQSSYSTPQYSVGQPSYSGYAAPKPKSDKKTFSLWAMIAALSGIILPIGLNSLAAIGLGIAGLVKENAKGMSITGLALGGLQLLVTLPIFWFGVVPILGAWIAYASYGY
jgi:hypothetical protein